MKQYFTRVLFATSFLVLVVSCTNKKESYGDGSHVYVIADSDTWSVLEDTLKTVFEHTVRTPQPEKVIVLSYVPTEKFGEFAMRKNLMIVGTLDSDEEISKKVSGMLSADVKAKVKDGSAYVFPKNNPWAANQNLLVLAGNSHDELGQKLLGNRDYLYNYFYKRLISGTRERMFSRLEQKELSEELMEKYGWSIRIQHDYTVNTERSDLNFYMLRRSLPGRERWLFVHWVDNADPAMINKEWLIDTRDRFTQEFYKGDLVNRNPIVLKFDDVNFSNRPALMAEGLWENETEMAGGPFKSYSFFDAPSGRIYLIDCAVYFPGGAKIPFLLQLDIMAGTFETINDVKNKSEDDS